jgi:hypothetical protein
LVTPVPLSPLLLLCCAYGGGSIKISLQAMPYKIFTPITIRKRIKLLVKIVCKLKCVGYNLPFFFFRWK